MSGGTEREAELRRYLMDSKTFIITFTSSQNRRQRQHHLRYIERIYQEMGGGGINAYPEPDNHNVFLIKPTDNPENNY